MRHNKLQTMFAWLAVLSIALIGDAFAQNVPSLVTQQTRLSTGGLSPAYVQLRAKQGVGTSVNFYAWDQAPAPTAGVNYSLWLDENNNIERSNSFGLAQKGYLLTVNPTGNGLIWTAPSSLVGANMGLTIDSTTTPGVSFVQLGAPTAVLATAAPQISSDRFIDLGSHALNFQGAGNFTVGDGTASNLDITLDQGQGATGAIHMKHVATDPSPLSSDRFLMLDGADKTFTRTLSSLVAANNGLSIDSTTVPGQSIVQLGGNPLLKNSSIDQATFSLSLTNGTLNLGANTNHYDINIDLGDTTHNINMKNIASDLTAGNILTLDNTGNVRTRPFGSLVSADNGLIATGSLISMGSPTAGSGAPLLTNRYISMASFGLNYEGSGSFNIGTSSAATLNITFDPGTAGFITMNDVAPLPSAKVDSTNRFVVLDAGTNNTYTRTLSSLVNADEGVTINNVLTPGTSTVELGSATDGNSTLTGSRFVTFSGATPSFSFDGVGTMNLGTTGNLAVSVNTGTADMTVQGANLDATAINNFAWIDSNTHVVHRTTTAAMVRQNTVNDYVGIDPTTGNIVRSISPTAGIYRGQIVGTGTYTYTSPAIPNLLAGASITCTVENHTGVLGAIVVQVTGVTTGTNGTFTVETSDDVQSGSFINYVVMNP